MSHPQLRDVPRLPVTSGLILISCITMLMGALDYELNRVDMSSLAFDGEAWRIWTTILLHGDFLHLLFNCFWIWRLGGYLELQAGHLVVLAAFAGPAAAASLLEYAIQGPAIGLSGMVYALAAGLWYAGRRRVIYRDAIDDSTLRFLIGWGILCVGLTVLDLWQVANIAHFGGAALGMLGASVLLSHGAQRLVSAGLFVLIFTSIALAASPVMRPRVAILDRSADELCYRGYRALVEQDYNRGLRLLENAARYPEVSKRCLHNLDVAQVRASD
jgi:membrane associated rhomboid family serine protease